VRKWTEVCLRRLSPRFFRTLPRGSISARSGLWQRRDKTERDHYARPEILTKLAERPIQVIYGVVAHAFYEVRVGIHRLYDGRVPEQRLHDLRVFTTP
jgi:hypothetical protein